MTSTPQARTGDATLGKAADENFPVAPFFLPRAWRDDLMAVYGYARLVDDIGDGDLAPGGADARHLGLDPEQGDDRLAMLDAFETDLHRVFATTGQEPRHPLLRALRPTVRRRALTPEPFLGLIEANRQDQKVRRYATYGELAAYCELSANPVGRLVLALTGTTSPERVRLSDAVCTALQIVEHLQDVAEDLGRDRIYLPAEDMDRFRVTEADLARPSARRLGPCPDRLRIGTRERAAEGRHPPGGQCRRQTQAPARRIRRRRPLRPRGGLGRRIRRTARAAQAHQAHHAARSRSRPAKSA